MKLRLNLVRLSGLFIFFSLFTLVSCEKESSQNGTNEQQEAEASRVSGEADATAEGVFNNLFDDVLGANDDVGVSGTGIHYGRGDTLSPTPRCFTVTITHPNNTPFPVIITVDFGNTGCLGPDGHVRKGKVITHYTARLIQPGAVATTTFDNYYVDDVKVEADFLKITNTSTGSTTPPANLARKFKIEVQNAKLTWPNGNYIKWNSTKNIAQLAGMATINPLDDVYQITGSATGQTLRNNLLVAWQSTITEPLIKRFTCRWIVKGKIRTARLASTVNASQIAVLDFGNGICDNLAFLTINGQTTQITLP